jgi:hypothetical protein
MTGASGARSVAALAMMAAAMGVSGNPASAPFSKHTDSNNGPPVRPRSGRATRWRPFGERHPDADFTAHDQARLDRAAQKRLRRGMRNLNALLNPNGPQWERP